MGYENTAKQLHELHRAYTIVELRSRLQAARIFLLFLVSWTIAMPTAKSGKQAIGCAYLVMICVVASFLLIVNIFLVGAFIHVNRNWLLGFYPDTTVQFRIAQAAQIFFPVIMTLMEFWIFDRIVDRAFGYGIRRPTKS